jgi:hypothetical protein
VLERLVQQYQNVTGDQIRRPKKRNLLAACYRVHGADVIDYIADEFGAQGTAQNLLGIIRSSAPRGTGDVPPPPDVEARSRQDAYGATRPSPAIAAVPNGIAGRSPDHDGPPCPIEHCLPNLIYCDDHYRFDPTSKRRYDRRPSNPDAASYFGGESSGPNSRSTTADGTRAR